MFVAVGNHVETLHRSRIGGLGMGDLESSDWRVLDTNNMIELFAVRDNHHGNRFRSE